MAHPESLEGTLEVDGVAYDDLLLIKAYEHAIGARENFELGKLVLCEAEPDAEMPPCKPPCTPSTSSRKAQLKVGQPVQALYGEDQKYYEATILKVFKTSCLVKFLGYNNKEKVSLAHMKESGGKAAQQKQIAEALAELDDLTEQETAQSSEVETDEMTECDSSRPSFGSPPNVPPFTTTPPPPFTFKGAQPMIPPPIPPHIMSQFPKTESELISSMLLSWYMSGYHTGYWQGYHAPKYHSTSAQRKSRRKK